MADNSSKAYEIYRFIQDMQKEQIKKKTIKPEDVIKISKDDFIRELQDTVNFYTKGTTNKRIIDDVYSNISTMIKNVSSIDEIISGKDIRIPVEVIAKSVDMAVQKNDVENSRIKEQIIDANTSILVSSFMSLESPRDKVAYIENLNADEQRELANAIIDKAFDEDIATIMKEEAKRDEERKKSLSYINADEESKKISDEVFLNNSLAGTIREELGFGKIQMTKAQEIVLNSIIAEIRTNPDRIDDIVEKNKTFLKDFMDSAQIEGFVQKMRNPTQQMNHFLKSYELKRDLRKEFIRTNKEALRKMFGMSDLPEELIEQFTDIEFQEIFIESFDLNGNFDCNTFFEKLGEIIQGYEIPDEKYKTNMENTDPKSLKKYFAEIFGKSKDRIDQILNENSPIQDSPEIPQEPQKPNASERDSKPVQEPVAPEVAEAASFFTFTANDMMSFATFAPSIGMEQDASDFMTAFASFAQIPDASVTPVYEASTDEIQVDPAILGMVDEERPTPPVVEETENDGRVARPEATIPPDIGIEEIELDDDEDRDSPEDPEAEENEKPQNIYGKDSFPGLIKAAEITINDMRSTQNELNPKDQNRINENNSLEDDKDTK